MRILLLLALPLSGGCSQETAPACKARLAFELLEPAGDRPVARFDHAMAVDFKGNRVFVSGGRAAGGKSSKSILGDTWVYFPATNQYKRLGSDSGMRPRSGHSLVYDPQGDKLVLFGGFSYSVFAETLYLRELWVHLSSEGWSREFYQTGPEGRAWHAAALSGDSMLLFGGFSGKPHHHRTDSWELLLESLAFRRLASEGGPRMAGRPVLLARNGDGGRFVFGRDGIPKPERAGIWRLDPETGRWLIPAGGKNPPVEFSQAVANAKEGTFLVLRGPEEGKRGWRAWYSSDARSWCRASTPEGPTTPQGMVCSPDPSRARSWICFGGVRRNVVSDKTWRLILQ